MTIANTAFTHYGTFHSKRIVSAFLDYTGRTVLPSRQAAPAPPWYF
ncbi:MAG TPA: hypothetical protein VFB76_11425 [Candidatus Angelobacter sp.]|nr:hypothetical protein [Candidatus Angelobacter sp.]